jgi:two-component system sensor histidine kinase DesK
MLKRKHSDAETKSDLNEIVDNATNLTDTMREMVWSLNPRNDTLSKFVDHTVQYAKHFFEPSEINFKIVSNQEFPDIAMSGFVRRNLFLCLKEIFNNIIKHAVAKNVSFSIKYVENKLTIIIQDDGIGIAENLREGNGLYSIKKRIADCEGAINWTNMDFGLCTYIALSL